MSDRDLVAALRAGDRLAAGQVYDIYGTRLYAYCHELLADPKLSADALRDTFIVAVNRIRELADPEEFGAWLYALARNECIRVGISDDAPADAAGAARGDRLMRLALDCYSMLEPQQRELLDLAFRHRLVDADLALVLGGDEAAMAARVATAQGDLETTLLVVLAARTGDPRCSEAAEFGAQFEEIDGRGIPHWLQNAGRHVAQCSICSDAVRNRRPLRLYEELPHSYMPPGVRSRVLEALRDPAGAAFAEQIAQRGGRFDEEGFPVVDKPNVFGKNKWLLPIGALVAAAAGIVGVYVLLTGGNHPQASATSATVTASTASPSPSPTPSPSSTPTPSPSASTGSPSATAKTSSPAYVPPPYTPPTSHTPSHHPTTPPPPPPPPPSHSPSPSPSPTRTPTPTPTASSSSHAAPVVG